MTDYRIRARTGTLGNLITYGIDLTNITSNYEVGGGPSRWAVLNKKTYRRLPFAAFFSDGEKKLHQYNLLAHYVRRVLPQFPMDEVVSYRGAKTLKEILIGDKRYLADGQKIKVLRADEKDMDEED